MKSPQPATFGSRRRGVNLPWRRFDTRIYRFRSVYVNKGTIFILSTVSEEPIPDHCGQSWGFTPQWACLQNKPNPSEGVEDVSRFVNVEPLAI